MMCALLGNMFHLVRPSSLSGLELIMYETSWVEKVCLPPSSNLYTPPWKWAYLDRWTEIGVHLLGDVSNGLLMRDTLGNTIGGPVTVAAL